MSANRYYRVTQPVAAVALVGLMESNEWAGGIKRQWPVYSPLDLQPGDELHDLAGITYAVTQAGLIYEYPCPASEVSNIRRGHVAAPWSAQAGLESVSPPQEPPAYAHAVRIPTLTFDAGQALTEPLSWGNPLRVLHQQFGTKRHS